MHHLLDGLLHPCSQVGALLVGEMPRSGVGCFNFSFFFGRSEKDENFDFGPFPFEISHNAEGPADKLFVGSGRCIRSHGGGQAGFHATRFGMAHEDDQGLSRKFHGIGGRLSNFSMKYGRINSAVTPACF